MLGIVGTVPDESFPLTCGRIRLDEEFIVIKGIKVAINRGTPALIGAAVKTGQVLGLTEIKGFLVGDIGLGKGSRALYHDLTLTLPQMRLDTLVFHYLQPDVDWHNRVIFAVEEMEKRPKLIADAGFMYAAKMSGQAPSYDLFTPDVGELAFLADETAPHPFYTRGFILHQDNQVPDLISRALEHGNAAQHLMVKGSTDYVVCKGKIIDCIDQPSADAMEAMGGTGDTLTGILSALVQAGFTIPEAAKIAALTNRLAGVSAQPTPASQVMDIIRQIPRALTHALKTLKISL
ncbi:MAG: sugar kinase [Desulfobacter sp.]|nr:sugar kinase [Desulfobacter sp.]